MHPGFKPMLSAKDFDVHHLTYPILYSDKYDGIRNCQLPDLGGVSRKIEPIPNKKINAYLKRPELAGFDGELIAGPATGHKVRQKSGAAWRRIEGEGMDEGEGVTFFVFDDFSDPSLGKLERYLRLQERVETLNDPHIKLVKHSFAHSPEELLAAFKDAEDRGFEGIMVSQSGGAYKFGRESVRYDRAAKKAGQLIIPEMLLGKLKSFVDEEGTIVGFVEEMENQNEATVDALGHTKRSTHQENKVGKGTLGAFILENPKYPKQYRCGTGLDAEQRRRFWEIRESLIGKQLTYKFQPSGMDQVPQFTSFVDIRDD